MLGKEWWKFIDVTDNVDANPRRALRDLSSPSLGMLFYMKISRFS